MIVEPLGINHARTNNNIYNRYQNKDSINVNNESIQLNNRASKVIISALKETNKTTAENLYFDALHLLDQSIKTDSTNYLALENMTNVLIKLDKRVEAIKVIDLIIRKNRYNAEAISVKGFILEKMGENSLAKKQFLKAINIYQNRPKKNTGEKVSDECNKVFLFLFLENKDKVIEKLDSLKTVFHKQEKIINSIETAALIFNKDEFLLDY